MEYEARGEMTINAGFDAHGVVSEDGWATNLMEAQFSGRRYLLRGKIIGT
jgi:hypothetical protein